MNDQEQQTKHEGVSTGLSDMLVAWIPVTERLPSGGTPVLVACGRKVLRATHAGKLELDEEDWGLFNDGDGGDYDEAEDMSYWPEGWYEWNESDETHWALDTEPTHWMPLPKPPNV